MPHYWRVSHAIGMRILFLSLSDVRIDQMKETNA
jgi:hypothetical protein